MGFALAEAAIAAGHEAKIIAGPVSLSPPPPAELISVETSDEMFDAVHAAAAHCDVLIMAAAVSDYKPRVVSPMKIKKQPGPFSLELEPTRDILGSLAGERQFVLVGFAAETNDVEANAQKKLIAKDCDLIIANDVSRSDVGMESDENEVTVLFRNGEMKRIARASKQKVARELIKIISNVCEKCLTKKS